MPEKVKIHFGLYQNRITDFEDEIAYVDIKDITDVKTGKPIISDAKEFWTEAAIKRRAGVAVGSFDILRDTEHAGKSFRVCIAKADGKKTVNNINLYPDDEAEKKAKKLEYISSDSVKGYSFRQTPYPVTGLCLEESICEAHKKKVGLVVGKKLFISNEDALKLRKHPEDIDESQSESRQWWQIFQQRDEIATYIENAVGEDPEKMKELSIQIQDTYDRLFHHKLLKQTIKLTKHLQKIMGKTGRPQQLSTVLLTINQILDEENPEKTIK